jgi:hypothetical protein
MKRLLALQRRYCDDFLYLPGMWPEEAFRLGVNVNINVGEIRTEQ